jgi:hypothetical protein
MINQTFKVDAFECRPKIEALIGSFPYKSLFLCLLPFDYLADVLMELFGQILILAVHHDLEAMSLQFAVVSFRETECKYFHTAHFVVENLYFAFSRQE